MYWLWPQLGCVLRFRLFPVGGWSGYICRSNCASAITFVPSCLMLSWLLERRNTSLRESLGAELDSLEDEGWRKTTEPGEEKSQKCHKHTHLHTHPDSRFKMHPRGSRTRLKAVRPRFQGRTERGEHFSQTSECVCVCVQGWFPRCVWVRMRCTSCYHQAALHLPHARHTNSSSQWNQRMKSLQGTLDTEGTQGGKRKRKRRLF